MTNIQECVALLCNGIIPPNVDYADMVIKLHESQKDDAFAEFMTIVLDLENYYESSQDQPAPELKIFNLCLSLLDNDEIDDLRHVIRNLEKSILQGEFDGNMTILHAIFIMSNFVGVPSSKYYSPSPELTDMNESVIDQDTDDMFCKNC